MTAAKDMSRPIGQHRLSLVSNASSSPARHSYSRTHSHSVSLGTMNATHRVSRRKSSSFTPSANAAVVAAAVQEAVADTTNGASHRSTSSRAALGALNGGSSYPTTPSSLPQHGSVPDGFAGDTVVDGPPLSSYAEISSAKTRRASEGTRLSKKEKNAPGDLKCEKCGKGYKHSSCLTKHMWEHTPEWQYTSKLLISKHQQVQLLEAATVLVAMNHDGVEVAKLNDSDNSSSPAASGSSDTRDDIISSTETTPPPQAEGSYRDNPKRYSTASSAYSRSYQSVLFDSAPTNDHGFAHYRQSSSSSNRSATAGTSIADSYPDEDHADLAAAVGLLSCSYGTPSNGPVAMPHDVPPVPPLPAKYQSAALAASDRNRFPGYREDVAMNDNDSSDDDGMFGTMET